MDNVGNQSNIVEEVRNLCRKLKNHEIQIKDMPLNSLLEVISNMYDMVGDVGGDFAALYGEMLIGSVEKRDADLLVSTVDIALNHLILLSWMKKQYDSQVLNTYRLRSRNACLCNREKLNEWQKNHSDEGKIPFTGRGVVYSAVTGGYDRIKEPQNVNPNLDYILFTDNPHIQSDVWKIRLIQNPDHLDNTRLARRIKILGHQYLEGYDYSVWIDGKLCITGDLQEYVQKNRGKQPMLCFNHYIHDCIYEEKSLCQRLQKDDPTVMDMQMERYRKEGYPAHNGLIDSAILVRELKNDRVIRLMESWWQEVLHTSKRDQLSFNYVCWKNDFVYDSTDLFIYGNEYVKSYAHG